MRSQCRLIWLEEYYTTYFLLCCSNIGSLILDLELASFDYQRKMLSRTTSKCENVFVYSKTFVVVLGRFCVHLLFSMCLQKTFFRVKLLKLCYSNALRIKLIGPSIVSSWPSPIPTQQDQNWDLINSMNMDRFFSFLEHHKCKSFHAPFGVYWKLWYEVITSVENSEVDERLRLPI